MSGISYDYLVNPATSTQVNNDTVIITKLNDSMLVAGGYGVFYQGINNKSYTFWSDPCISCTATNLTFSVSNIRSIALSYSSPGLSTNLSGIKIQ